MNPGRGRNASLVRVLALMQRLTRARASLQNLAQEFGVTERTIRRDIDALSLAGVPIWNDTEPCGKRGRRTVYRVMRAEGR